MALPSWAKDTITRIRPGTKTSRGSTVPDWSSGKTNSLSITGCSVQPAATGLSQDGRVLGISEGLTIYLPPGSDVQAGDHISYDSKDYEIIGEPKVWKSAKGRVSHIAISVERWKG